MLLLAFFLFLLAFILLWIASRQRKSAGLPGGRIIYSDTNRWERLEKPLYDPVLEITGRPDYLVEQGEALIPVEVKSRRVSRAPYDSHIYQLAAYCLLVQRVFGKRPPYGILHYENRTFSIDYTQEMEVALLDVITEMRTQERRRDVERSHDSPERCARCGFRSVCDQALSAIAFER
jgi:CRISPR-associated exonuclease Cas4